MYAAILTPRAGEGQPQPCEFLPYVPDPGDLPAYLPLTTYPRCLWCEMGLDDGMDTGVNAEGVVVLYFPDDAPQGPGVDCYAHARCMWDEVLMGRQESFTIVPSMADAFRATRQGAPRHSTAP